jgi:hypothetical protein
MSRQKRTGTKTQHDVDTCGEGLDVMMLLGQQDVVLADPVRRIEEQGWARHRRRDRASKRERSAGGETAGDVRIRPRPAVDDDQPVEPVGMVERQLQPASAAAWPGRWAFPRAWWRRDGDVSPAIGRRVVELRKLRSLRPVRDGRRDDAEVAGQRLHLRCQKAADPPGARRQDRGLAAGTLVDAS